MDKSSNHKSKTPNRPILHLAPEEIKELQESLFKFGNSPEGITERANLTESLNIQPIHERSVSLDTESLAILKIDLQAKQNIISTLSLNQKDLMQSIAKLKAQNNTLNKELNACRTKNYELDVELYLAKEEICAKSKEAEKLKYEIESLQQILKNTKDENLSLKEENSRLRTDFHRKKNIKAIENEKRRYESEENSKRSNSNIGNGFKLKNLRVKTAQRSPEKSINYTERNEKEDTSILSDLQIILNVDQPSDVLSTVVQMMESVKSLKKLKKFFSQLTDLVLECSPSGVFVSKPNIKQVWMWITRLLEEYMKLKKSTVL